MCGCGEPCIINDWRNGKFGLRCINCGGHDYQPCPDLDCLIKVCLDCGDEYDESW